MLGNATVYATIAVNDLQVAKDFYEGKLGLRQAEESQGGIMYESGTGKLFVYQSSTAGTGQATCASWLVDDVRQTAAGLRRAGVIFDNYDIPGADVDGYIYTVGEQKAAWFKDPDGNILNIASKF